MWRDPQKKVYPLKHHMVIAVEHLLLSAEYLYSRTASQDCYACRYTRDQVGVCPKWYHLAAAYVATWLCDYRPPYYVAMYSLVLAMVTL